MIYSRWIKTGLIILCAIPLGIGISNECHDNVCSTGTQLLPGNICPVSDNSEEVLEMGNDTIKKKTLPVPPIDLAVHQNIETATFALG